MWRLPNAPSICLQLFHNSPNANLYIALIESAVVVSVLEGRKQGLKAIVQPSTESCALCRSFESGCFAHCRYKLPPV